MLLYLVPAPMNKLDAKGRETGWHRVPLDKDSKKEFREQLQLLKDKELMYVIGSDLDTEAVNIAGNELHLPCEFKFELRRFNLGRHHAAPSNIIDTILGGAILKWKDNPDIPIRGGDSFTSYRKRFLAFISNKLLPQKGTAALVLGLREIRSIRNNNPEYWTRDQKEILRGKIYIAEPEIVPEMSDANTSKQFLPTQKRKENGQANCMV